MSDRLPSLPTRKAAGLLKEFQEFASRGNAIELAVAVILGGAFGKIVDSIVRDLLMPLLGLLIGRVDFTNLYLILGKGRSGATTYTTLKAAAEDGASTLNYGLFLNALVQFAIITLAIFLAVKAINALRRQPLPAASAQPQPSRTEQLLQEIRDLLKQR